MYFLVSVTIRRTSSVPLRSTQRTSIPSGAYTFWIAFSRTRTCRSASKTSFSPLTYTTSPTKSPLTSLRLSLSGSRLWLTPNPTVSVSLNSWTRRWTWGRSRSLRGLSSGWRVRDTSTRSGTIRREEGNSRRWVRTRWLSSITWMWWIRRRSKGWSRGINKGERSWLTKSIKCLDEDCVQIEIIEL